MILDIIQIAIVALLALALGSALIAFAIWFCCLIGGAVMIVLNRYVYDIERPRIQ